MNESKDRSYSWHLWLTFATIFSLGIAILAEHHYSHRQNNERVDLNLRSLASQLNDKNFEHVRQHLDGVAKIPFILSTVKGDKLPDNPEALAAMTGASFASKASFVYLLNSEGVTVACTPYDNGKTLTGNSYAFRPYFTKVMDSGKPEFYAAVGVTTGKRGIYVSVPVTDGNVVSGVLIAKLNLTGIDSGLANNPTPTALVSPDGIIFSANRKDWLFKTVLPITENRRQLLRETKQFASEELMPLGYDLSQAKIVFEGKDYEMASVSVIDGQWRIVNLFEPPPFNTAIFGLCAGVVWSFIALASYGCRFYHGLRQSQKQLKTTNQELKSRINERKQSEEKIKSLAKFPSENPNPVLRVDENGEVLYSNKAGEMLLLKLKSGVGRTVPKEWQDLISKVIESEKIEVRKEEVTKS